MTRSPDPRPDQVDEPRHLRLLRRLVTTLTVVLIGAVITVVALLVIRLGAMGGTPRLPDSIAVPVGETLISTTQGRDWSAIVTTDDQGTQRIHVLDAEGGIARTILID